LGGKYAVLTELDRATRVEELNQALAKILRCRLNLVPELLQRLESPDITIAQKATIALGYLGSPEAVVPLVRALQSRQQHLYWQATAALSRIGDTQALDFLMKALQSSSVQLQSATAKALGKCGLPAVAPLLRVIGDDRTDDLVKFHAIHSLGEIGSPLAVQPLINLLDRKSKHIRSEAIWALGQIRSPLAIIPLADRLTDSDLGVQSAAAHALKAIGAPALPALLAMLKNSSSLTRSVAIRTLAQLGFEEAVANLAEVLFGDPFPYVRSDAAQALGEIGSRSAIVHLGMAVRDQDRSVRTAAIRALRKVKSPEAGQILRQIDPQWANQETTILQQRAQFTVRDNDYTILQSTDT
jgi:HEAT repeat protein